MISYTRLAPVLARCASIAGVRSRNMSTNFSVTVKPKWILQYSFVPRMTERREPYRGDHLERVKCSVDKGDLILAGALEPAESGVLVFNGEEAAKKFAQADPYVTNGLVIEWNVKKWNTVHFDD